MCRVLVINDDSGQSEICHFRNQVFSNQNISSSQITMDQALALQMGHAAGNLEGKTFKLGKLKIQRIQFGQTLTMTWIYH